MVQPQARYCEWTREAWRWPRSYSNGNRRSSAHQQDWHPLEFSYPWLRVISKRYPGCFTRQRTCGHSQRSFCRSNTVQERVILLPFPGWCGRYLRTLCYSVPCHFSHTLLGCQLQPEQVWSQLSTFARQVDGLEQALPATDWDPPTCFF